MKRDPIYLVVPIHGTTSVAKFADPNDAVDFTEKLVDETSVSHTIFEAVATCVAGGADPDKEFESVKPVQENVCKNPDCLCHSGDFSEDPDGCDDDDGDEPVVEAPKLPKEIASIGGFIETLRAVKRSRELTDELVMLVKGVEHPQMRATLKKCLLSFLTSELEEV